MAVIKSGKPLVESAGSVNLGLAVAETTPNEISVTNVVANALANFNDGAFIVVDPHSGRVMATSIAARIAEMNALFAGSTKLDLTPDAGQTGRSLSFSAAAGNDLAGIVSTDLTTAVKPKFTVESLVSRLLAKIQEREAAAPGDANKFFIVVDQINKKVGIRFTATPDVDVDLSSVAYNAGESFSVALTPEAEAQTSNPLPFEGGAV